jgi:hypothetical protein
LRLFRRPGKDALNPPLKLFAVQHHPPATPVTLRANVGAGADYGPFAPAAGMQLPQLDAISRSYGDKTHDSSQV